MKNQTQLRYQQLCSEVFLRASLA